MVNVQTAAQEQYFNRPDDERFASLEALHEFCSAEDRDSQEMQPGPARSVTVENVGGGLTVGGCTLTNWSFNQAANRAGFGGGQATKLCEWGRADLAAECLNTGFSNAEQSKQVIPYVRAGNAQSGGRPILRALTSERYTRVLNSALTAGLLRLGESGWCVPPAWGDKPSGLYASDRDLWVYMIDDENRSIVKDPEAQNRAGEDLGRGFFLWNSEVGARSFGLLCFWFNWTCGNHMVMGARYVREIRIRHVGHIRARIQSAMRTTAQLAGDTTQRTAELDRIKASMTERLSSTDDKLPKVLQGLTGLGPKTVDAAIERSWAEGSNPHFAWGAVQGITALARDEQHGDRANELRMSARVLLDGDRGRALKALTV
jgi:hypothetical protein